MEKFFLSVDNLSKDEDLEGYFIQEQTMQLDVFLKSNPEIVRIGEIGFNVGMSAVACLNARPDTLLFSFDLGAHPYISAQKNIIDELFPTRHTLIIGDSRNSLPALVNMYQEPIFDMMIVDGGHDGDLPYLDIKHSLDLVKPGGWIYVDDVFTKHFCLDVEKAVNRAIEEGLLTNTEFYECSNRRWLLAQKPELTS